MAEIDPFTLEVIKNRLASIADDMALTVARTARSFIVKEALDYSTALFGANSEFIAQGTCLPLHLGSMPAALNAVLKQFGDDIAPGADFEIAGNEAAPRGEMRLLGDDAHAKPLEALDQYHRGAHLARSGGERQATGAGTDHAQVAVQALSQPSLHVP